MAISLPPAPQGLCGCGCGRQITAAGPSQDFATPACQRAWQGAQVNAPADPYDAAERAVLDTRERRSIHYHAQLVVCAQQYDQAIACHASVQAYLQAGYSVAPGHGLYAPVRRCRLCGEVSYPITEIHAEPPPRRGAWGAMTGRAKHPPQVDAEKPYHDQRCRACRAVHLAPPMIGMLSFDAETLIKISYVSVLPGFTASQHVAITPALLDPQYGSASAVLTMAWTEMEHQLITSLCRKAGVPLPK